MDNHYVPQFYLRQWANSDCEVCEFSRPHKTLVARMKPPSATGFMPDLYALPALPQETKHVLETQFFRQTDQQANDALTKILQRGPDTRLEMSLAERSAWTRFMLSLRHRTPEQVAELRDAFVREISARKDKVKTSYEGQRGPTDPETFDEWIAGYRPAFEDGGFAQLFQRTIDNPRVGALINDMTWHTIRFPSPSYPLLTSDRAVIMTDGLAYAHSFIVMPISPIDIFVATNTDKQEQIFREMSGNDLFRKLNNAVCKSAQRYVYGTDKSQCRFVDNRLGHGLASDLQTLPDNLLRHYISLGRP